MLCPNSQVWPTVWLDFQVSRQATFPELQSALSHCADKNKLASQHLKKVFRGHSCDAWFIADTADDEVRAAWLGSPPSLWPSLQMFCGVSLQSQLQHGRSRDLAPFCFPFDPALPDVRVAVKRSARPL